MQPSEEFKWAEKDKFEEFEDCDVPDETPMVTKKIGNSKVCHGSLLSSNKGRLRKENRTEFLHDLKVESTNKSVSPVKYRCKLFFNEKVIPVLPLPPVFVGKKKTKTSSFKKYKKVGRKSVRKKLNKRSVSIMAPCGTKLSNNTVSSGEEAKKSKKDVSIAERMAKHQSMKVSKHDKEYFALQLTIGDVSPP
ncbi:unnamed protein product [Moneuplotes crassus]|uniref:Uncharacterized protein n=1 Tax=Euplotes crassus TaxID=5936 RepID=A0AAD1XAU1_EUPCR|nr:unnamed protein product [Moneuplotes crassus]